MSRWYLLRRAIRLTTLLLPSARLELDSAFNQALMIAAGISFENGTFLGLYVGTILRQSYRQCIISSLIISARVLALESAIFGRIEVISCCQFRSLYVLDF